MGLFFSGAFHVAFVMLFQRRALQVVTTVATVNGLITTNTRYRIHSSPSDDFTLKQLVRNHVANTEPRPVSFPSLPRAGRTA